MTSNRNELYELQQRILRLSREDQLYLVESILADVRDKHFTDHEALDRDMAEMAADPGMQRVLRGEDLPYGKDSHEAR